MKRPFFSLIIPCHNSHYIGKLFDSLTRQGINKEDLEIIVVDDNSDDKSYIDIIKSYDFNYIFTQTDTDIHCPGNTRQKGMKYVTGEWLFFADHDDYFEDGVLAYIKDYINNTTDHLIYEIISGITYMCDDGEILWRNECSNSWLHGKWYSVDNLINKYGICFKKDLTTNEDCYFNCQVFNTLIELDKDFDYLGVYTYNWIAYPDSLCHRSNPEIENDRGYMFNDFDNFIFAVTEPYWENAVNTKDDRFIRPIISGLLFFYFYYEVADYYRDINDYFDIYLQIQFFIERVVNEIGLSRCDIVNYVYQDPAFYEETLSASFTLLGHFIPRISFQDFVLNYDDSILEMKFNSPMNSSQHMVSEAPTERK